MPSDHQNYRAVISFAGLLLTLILSACSSLHRDGPPSRSVDVSRIPDAIPKVEPLSRYGNLPRYRVNGVTYHVRSTSHNYQERGIASWYGTKFDAHTTSSGEIYNMLGMTAAHKTLPLPTYARVTNLHNHKSVVVKINDRGPFAPGRIIDLSYAAAKKLGMTGYGTAFVEVRAIDPSKKPEPLHLTPVFTARRDLPEKIFVRVGTFQNRQFAERLKKRIIHLVESPVLITRPPRGKIFYRVEIGPLLSPVAVSRIRQRLKTAGIDQGSIIRHPTEV